ncbi:hypothetical protein Tco_1340421, partial [Tanacetum coccineum]
DMLVASQSLDELKTLKTQLKSEFEMKDLDELKMILGFGKAFVEISGSLMLSGVLNGAKIERSG